MTAPAGALAEDPLGQPVLEQPVVAELRHELRTPINLVVGYCEMLLEDAVGDALAPRREALEAALAAVRDALALVSRTLPPSEQSVPRARIVALAEALREPQGRILDAVDRLLATGADDAALVDDADKVRSAARQLLTVLGGYPPPSAEPEATAPADAGGRPGRATILVVDDIADNRTLLERRLRREGHAVLCAADGRRALELLATMRVDLVLLDVMMPELDGVTVLARMKANPVLRELPVVMISALDDVQSIADCIEKGADDYLPKPFDPVLLRARVGALLERKRLRDEELSYLRRVRRLVRAAGAIEEGTYARGTLDDVAARGDDLGQLARVLDGMAVRVRSREDRLHEQIRQLEAEVALAAASTHTADTPAPESPGPLPVGEIFAGRYAVRALIGRGGMGTVYLADDRELGEPVAIKTLDRALVASDASALERFKSEIRLARRISHRNVVRTHDLGAYDGVHYVTMEYVRGITLRELLDTRGRLAVDATIAIGVQLARALEVAHEQGVIHRDVKPQNLMLDPQGVLKVMDFGIARLTERTSTLTRVGMVIGTPTYMSPEQLLDEPLDARSDLYATGVVLFEALAGRPPYSATSVMGLVGRILSEAPPRLTTLNPAVPAPVADVVHALLARDRAERLASAAEVAARLGALA